MFRKGRVYLKYGQEVQWVGVVTRVDEDKIEAIEIAVARDSGKLLGLNMEAQFSIHFLGERILLTADSPIELE